MGSISTSTLNLDKLGDLFTDSALACHNPTEAAGHRSIPFHWLQPGEAEADLAAGVAPPPARRMGLRRLIADGETIDEALVVVFEAGASFTGEAVAELCFNTAMTGYQEIMTDPSYAGQIVTFTFPHVGNVGANPEDEEATSDAARKAAVGMVSRTHVVPISATQDTAGPMTRTVYDAALLLSAMAGSDPSDSATAEADENKTDFSAGLDEFSLAGVRIGVMRNQVGNVPGVTALFEQALADMEVLIEEYKSPASFSSQIIKVFQRAEKPVTINLDTMSEIIGKSILFEHFVIARAAALIRQYQKTRAK